MKTYILDKFGANSVKELTPEQVNQLCASIEKHGNSRITEKRQQQVIKAIQSAGLPPKKVAELQEAMSLPDDMDQWTNYDATEFLRQLKALKEEG